MMTILSYVYSTQCNVPLVVYSLGVVKIKQINDMMSIIVSFPQFVHVAHSFRVDAAKQQLASCELPATHGRKVDASVHAKLMQRRLTVRSVAASTRINHCQP